jgi:hypothetical protein
MLPLVLVVIVGSLCFHAAHERGQPSAKWVVRGVAAYLIPTLLWEIVRIRLNATFWVANMAARYVSYRVSWPLAVVALCVLAFGGDVIGTILAEWTRRRMIKLASAGVDDTTDRSDESLTPL